MPASPELQRLTDLLHSHYRVEGEIGRGGMGVVVRARDLRLDRPVAIKTLPYHLATDANIRERFLREARTAASLSHPNIVSIYHAAEIEDVVFFVMGLVEGESVAQRVRERGRLPAIETIAVLHDVANALAYAHDRGVIHRDIKAENILLDRVEDRAMVTDFGIARLTEAAPMTATGTVLGSVHYMSPEQVAGERADARSDLYSLGVLAFFMLSGRFPFEHESSAAVLVAHVTRPTPPLRSLAPEVPHRLALVVDRLLSKVPSARFAAASDVIEALREATEHLTDSQPPAPSLSSSEARAVWERAALLQELTGQLAPPPNLPQRSTPASSETAGLAIGDVMSAAEQAGIDRKYVDRALAETRPDQALSPHAVRPGAAMQDTVNPWVGARGRLEFEAVVPGELDDNGLEEIADEMRRRVGEFGAVNSRGRTVEFTAAPITANGLPRRLQVTVTSRGGKTTVRAFEDFRQTIHGTLGGVTGGVGGGVGGATFGALMGVTKSVLIAAPAFAAIGLAAYGASRLIVHHMARRKERTLRDLVGAIAVRAAELIEQAPPTPALPVPRKRLGR